MSPRNNKFMALITFISWLTAGMLLQVNPAFGDLDPPTTAVDGTGTPVATMRTLQQLEPRTPVTSLPYTISEPGSYYLVSNLTGTHDRDGIRITTNDVTLDLNGYTLAASSTSTSGEGIRATGNLKNLHILNGAITGWPENGIFALTADNAIFENLSVSHNGGNGLDADTNCIIIGCTAYNNGRDGLLAGSGTLIKNCSAQENGSDGIQSYSGCAVLDSVSSGNAQDGFSLYAQSLISRCVAEKNHIHGIDIRSTCLAIACVAGRNGKNGFDITSACYLRDCTSTENSENGFKAHSNGYLTGNNAHANTLAGIYITSDDTLITDNQCTDNKTQGIQVTSTGNLLLRNRAAGNTKNYNIKNQNPHGPIVMSGSGNLTGAADGNHPQANLAY